MSEPTVEEYKAAYEAEKRAHDLTKKALRLLSAGGLEEILAKGYVNACAEVTALREVAVLRSDADVLADTIRKAVATIQANVFLHTKDSVGVIGVAADRLDEAYKKYSHKYQRLTPSHLKRFPDHLHKPSDLTDDL